MYIYIHFYISKNKTSYAFLLVFKIVESLQCILKCSSPKNSSSQFMKPLSKALDFTNKGF